MRAENETEETRQKPSPFIPLERVAKGSGRGRGIRQVALEGSGRD